MRKIRSRKAVSPVIATVILVAVAITVAVAVSYWMGGISSQYTKFEKVEIQSATCTYDSAGFWNVSLKMKNTGTATASLIAVFINELEVEHYNDTIVQTDSTSTSMTGQDIITSGDELTFWLAIDNGYATLSSGTTINVKIHSAGGMDYIKLVELV